MKIKTITGGVIRRASPALLAMTLAVGVVAGTAPAQADDTPATPPIVVHPLPERITVELSLRTHQGDPGWVTARVKRCFEHYGCTLAKGSVLVRWGSGPQRRIEVTVPHKITSGGLRIRLPHLARGVKVTAILKGRSGGAYGMDEATVRSARHGWST